MTWHLKDRVLEEKLNKLVGNNQFTEALNRECIGIQNKKIIVIKFGENTGHVKGSFRCYLGKSELMNIGYDPHQWNNYPEVTPPENVWMRLEICPGSEDSGRVGAKYVNGKWLLDDGTIENFGDYPARFRPWED